MFCKHSWKVIVDKYDAAPFSRAGLTKISTDNGGKFPEDLFKGTRIFILECTKCGKLDKTIEKV